MLQAKTTVDTKKLKALIRKMETLDNYCGEAGFDDRMHHKHRVPMSYIAEVNEYGDEDQNIPARPFMMTAGIQGQVGVGSVFTRNYEKFVLGKISSRVLMARTAQEESEWIADVIRNNSFHANAALTVKLKGSSQPLVDSGYMADNVQSKAVRTSEVK